MSKTVHPYSFRLGILRNWRSRWFNPGKYRMLLKTDVLVREALEKKMRGMFVESIEIERSPGVFHLIIRTSRPGLLIGRKGEGADKIKSDVLGMMKKIGSDIPKELKLTIEEVSHPEASAKILSQMAAESLEKRTPFRRVMKQIIEKGMANSEVKGVKVAMAGRLDGAEMGRKEWLRKGRIPLQTLRADIDFAREKAHLPYGDIGIKVWVFKGEKFDKQ
ncbi:30S ribosomal protein S3 [Candidatus Parcubacteria bacterium]|nr:MAG: 30S ribosomal protein S3 [Candidatus Parcubacteria bacterium]